MAAWRALLLIALAPAAPAAAQERAPDAGAQTLFPAQRWIEPALPAVRPGIAMPVVEYRVPDGGFRLRRGIVAGREVAPRLMLGVGLFETARGKDKPATDHPLDVRPKKSRRAAIGLNLAF